MLTKTPMRVMAADVKEVREPESAPIEEGFMLEQSVAEEPKVNCYPSGETHRDTDRGGAGSEAL